MNVRWFTSLVAMVCLAGWTSRSTAHPSEEPCVNSESMSFYRETPAKSSASPERPVSQSALRATSADAILVPAREKSGSASGNAYAMTPGPAGAVVQAPVLRVDARLSLNDKPGGAGAEKVAAAGPSAQWELTTEDRTLKNALSRWCRQAGWQLLWDLRVDYALSSRATLHGNFEEAVSRVMRDMSEAETPLHAVLYRGNKVLRIVARGSD